MKTRIVAMLCVLSMMFAIPVYAFEMHEYKKENKTAGLIEHILNENGQSMVVFEDDIATRGEFAQILTQILSKGNIEMIDCDFSDVEVGSELSYALYYAEKAGIIAEAEKFYPNDGIKLIEAEKMAVCALGYKVRAEVQGGYPKGYSEIANELSLLDGIKTGQNEVLGKEDAYLLINHMLTANVYDIYSASGNNVYYNTVDKTLLKKLYDIECIGGIVTADEHTSITDANGSVGEGVIRIGTENVFYNGEEDYLGYGVKAYVKELDGKRECIYIEPYKTNVVEFSGREYDTTEGKKIKVDVDGKTKKFNLSDSAVYIYNKKAITAQQAKSLISGKEYTVKMTDYDADGEFDCILIKQYSYCMVKSVDTNKDIIVDENGTEGMIKFPDDASCRIYGTYKGERISSIEDIQSGMLLAAVVGSDGTAVEVYVCQNSKNIVIASVSDKNKTFTTSDGEDYDYGTYFEENYREKITLNTSAIIFLGINGEAVVGQFETVGSQYGWVVSCFKEDDTNRDGWQLKIYTSNGKMQTFNVNKKVYINGAKTTASIGDVVNTLAENNRLIKYTLNSNGEIKNVDTAIIYDESAEFPDYSDDKNSLTLFYDGTSQTIQYHENSGAFADKFNITEAEVFVVPQDAESQKDEMKYSVGLANLINDQYYNVMAYDLNESLKAGAIVVFEDLTNIGKVTTGGVVVQDIYETINDEDEICYGISVYNNGQYQYLYSNTYTEEKVKELDRGDIVRLRLSGNTITGIQKEYSFTNDEVIPTYTEGSNFDWLKGLVYDINGDALSIIKDARELPSRVSYSQLKYIKLPNSVAYIDISKGGDGKIKDAVVRSVLEQNINGAVTAGNDATFVVVQRKNYRAERVFVYIVD